MGRVADQRVGEDRDRPEQGDRRNGVGSVARPGADDRRRGDDRRVAADRRPDRQEDCEPAVDGRLAILLAVGAAVCGNTAVVATSPVIGARPRDTAYAVATVTLFGTIAVFAYPLIGHAAHLGDPVFGLWSGIAINDTSQVVAASAAYSPGAFEVATVVKLIRNALMAPLLLGIAWAWGRRTGEAGDTRTGLRRAVPLFVLGFLALSALRSVGVVDAGLATTFEAIARALVLVALAAVGLSVRLDDLRRVGPKPLLVGLGVALVIGVVTIVAITGLGLADGLVVTG
jgi:uncharacterized integral membrane protein (TIGR00698 family)